MASPEVVESSGILLPGFHEEPFALGGWKKKLMLKKRGTPKKKDVVYVAPDGEEIRNKRQLEKYLKTHPGGPSAADFDWSTGETPRRSARLSNKGRLSSDSAEAELAFKRSKWDQDEDPVIVVSPRKSSRRKPGPPVVSTGKDEVMEDTEKREQGDRSADDGLTVDFDRKLADEKVLPRIDETLQNNTDGKHGTEGITVTIEEVNLGESAEQVPATKEVTSVGNYSAHEVNAERQASKIEEPLIVKDTVMEEVTAVEVAVVEEVVTQGQPVGTIEVSAVDEVVQPTEGEQSLNENEDVKEELSQDVLDVPTTERLDGTDDDPLKQKDHIESQGIHALIEEPILSGVIKSPEQQTEHPLPAAERVVVST